MATTGEMGQRDLPELRERLWDVSIPGRRPVRLPACGPLAAAGIRGLGTKSSCRADSGARAWRPCAPESACHRLTCGAVVAG